LLERDIFDLFLPEFDKPWVIHLRETCCCSKTSALGGPTLSTRIEAFIDINGHAIWTLKCTKYFYALDEPGTSTLLIPLCSGVF
jgi:hypothetical protein